MFMFGFGICISDNNDSNLRFIRNLSCHIKPLVQSLTLWLDVNGK